MRGIILAAGRGSRLSPHTDRLPKALLPFAGRDLLSIQQRALAAAGVTELIIVAGYRADSFAGCGLPLLLNHDWERSNMVHSLFCARSELQRGEPIVVAYGDIVYEPRVAKAVVGGGGELCVGIDLDWLELWNARHLTPLVDAESLILASDGRILDLGRPPRTLSDIQGQYMGIMRFTPAALDAAIELHDGAKENDPWLMGRTLANCYMTDFLRGLIGLGIDVRAATVHGGWLEFDSSMDLQTYEDLLATGGLRRLYDANDGTWASAL